MYSAVSIMGRQEIGHFKLLGGYQEIQECTTGEQQDNYHPGGPFSFLSGIEPQDYSLAANVIEDLGLFTMDPVTSRTVLMFLSSHIIFGKYPYISFILVQIIQLLVTIR